MFRVIVMLEYDVTHFLTVVFYGIQKIRGKNALVIFSIHFSFGHADIAWAVCAKAAPDHYRPTTMFDGRCDMLVLKRNPTLSPAVSASIGPVSIDLRPIRKENFFSNHRLTTSDIVSQRPILPSDVSHST